MKDFLIKMISDAVGKLANVFEDPIIQNAAKVGDIINEATSRAGKNAFTGVQAIAASLMLCLFLIRFAESALKDKNDPDSLFKDIATLVLFGTIISKLPELIDALSTICQSIISAATVNFNTSPGIKDALTASLESSEGLASLSLIPLIFKVVIYFIFGTILNLVLLVIAFLAIYTVKIELFIRTIFAPLGVAFLADEGWRGAGGRYIRKWAACYLQMAIISVALKGYNFLLTLAIQDGTNFTIFFVSVVAVAFAVAGICMKSSSLAGEIMGT